MPDKTPKEAEKLEAADSTVTTTRSELKELVGEAVQAATTGLAEKLDDVAGKVEGLTQAAEEAKTPAPEEPIVTTHAELDKAVGKAVQGLSDQVSELADKVQEVVEAAKPQTTEEAAPAEQTETAVQAVKDVQAQATEEITAHADQAAEDAKAQVTATVEEAKVAIAEEIKTQVAAAKEEAQKTDDAKEQVKTEIAAAIVEEVKTQVAAQAIAPTSEKIQADTVVVKQLASASKVHSYTSVLLTLIFAAGMMVFAVLYLQERSKSEQQAVSDAKTIRALSQDLVSIHMVKNENIEAAIQNKIDLLKAEGTPEAKAIPMAYIDDEVVKEVVSDLPASVKSQPYVDELAIFELRRFSAFAEKELNKELNNEKKAN